MAEKNTTEKEILDFFPMLEKYSSEEIKIEDPGLKKYINTEVSNIFMGGVNSNKIFAKSKYPIVERLINNIMRTEKYTGKKTKAYKAVRDAFEIIDKKMKKNPLQVLIDAVQNAAPKEEATRLRFGGISVPKAVDVAPQRRIDIAVRNIATGVTNSSKKNKKNIAVCIADELMKASKNDVNSFSISKKNDVERVAKSAR